MTKKIKYLTPLIIGAAVAASLYGDMKTSIALLAASCFVLWACNLKTIALLLCASIAIQDVRAVPKDVPPQKPEWVGQLCAGIVVLVVGGVVYVGLKKLCNKCLPPPTAPTNPPATNAPPRNSSFSSAAPLFEFDDSAMSVYDISQYSATNAALHGPDGYPYLKQFTYKFRYSTNAVNWITNSIVGYVSPTLIHATCNGESAIYSRQSFPTFSVGGSGNAGFFQPVP